MTLHLEVPAWGGRASVALVTGAGGFTGLHLTKLLLERGMRVVGVARPGPSAQRVMMSGAELALVDLHDRAAVLQLVADVRPGMIFHLAALTRSNDLGALLSANVEATDHLLMAAAQVAPLRFFIAGSAAEYGLVGPEHLPISEATPTRPVSAYGVSKLAQTSLGLARHATTGLDVYIGRLFNCVGPGEPPTTVCSAIARQAVAISLGLQEPILSTGALLSERDFLDIRDVVEAYWAIVERGLAGIVYNVCSGVGTPIATLPGLLLEAAGVQAEVRAAEGPPGQVDVRHSYGDPTRLHTDTGWAPRVSLRTSLGDLADAWRRQLLTEPTPQEVA